MIRLNQKIPHRKLGEDGQTLKSNKNYSTIKFLFLVILTLTSFALQGQTSIDISVGSSFQDYFKTQIVFRNQFTSKFNGGLELQTGLPQYRFVGTKVMREGYTYSLSLPVSFLIQDQDKIQLYGIGRIGARFQGIIDPDNNDTRDSILASTAVIGEFGLMTTFQTSEKVNLQSGMTLPIAYEVSSLTIMEYMQVRLHLGGNYTKNKTTIFAQSSLGAAFGATGDTYKYIWSVDLGAFFKLGESKNERFTLIQTSF